MKIIGKISSWMLLALFALSPTTEITCAGALPNIAKNFWIDDSTAQMLSSIYFAGFAIGIFSLGRVSDVIGRRPIVLSGLFLYIVVTIASFFAKTIETLMLLRFLQAFGASVGSVIAQAMARDCYQGRELSYVYASLSMGLAFFPSLGSAVSGYILEYYGWRYIFVFLTIISCLVLLLALRYVPETNPYIGVSRNNKYFRVLKIVINDKIVLLYAVIVGSFNGINLGFYIEAPFIFINQIGLSPSLYGKLALLLSAASFGGSLMTRWLTSKFVDTRKIMRSGLNLSLIGCSLLVLSSFIMQYVTSKIVAILLIFMPMMLQLIGHSFLVPMSLRYALEDYSKVTGTAGSVFGLLYYMLVAMISFVISKLHSDTIVKFTLLFFTLSLSCNIAFYLIQKWHPLRKRYEFL